MGTGEAGGPPTAALYGYAPKRFNYDASLSGNSLFLGCHERDPHIPLARVHESGAVFDRLGSSVTVEITPGAGHGIVEEEVRALRGLYNR